MFNYNDPNLVWVEHEGFKIMSSIKFLDGPLDGKVLYDKEFRDKYEVCITPIGYVSLTAFNESPVLKTGTYTKVRQRKHQKKRYNGFDVESYTHLWEVYLWDDLKPDEREYTLNADWFNH